MGYPIRVRACSLIIENEQVLLVKFQSEEGIHYNLPAGGVEKGESVIEAVRREAKEEAGIDVEVGELAFVFEYAPHLLNEPVTNIHGLHLIFECHLKEGSIPHMPAHPDSDQIGVEWVPLHRLNDIVLYPAIQKHIVTFAHTKRTIPFLEERLLIST
ncbi:NUDIX domain-containing protein [Aeribacillus pallidus]|uniref:NUDIX domain-containing protein n=1 Tax=Aeribacillus pallidus TaxID=33936 RepID=UPI003D21C31C